MSFRMTCGTMKTMVPALLMLSMLVVSTGCRTNGITKTTTGVENEPGGSTKVVDPEETSSSSTIGIESIELERAAKSMVGKMLANPRLNEAGEPRNIIVDSEYFTVGIFERLNKNLLIDVLRVHLFNAAKGRIRFVSRKSAAMWEQEGDLRAQGVVEGVAGEPKQMRVDFRLIGTISSHRTNDGRVVDNYILMVFEMVDVNTAEIVFSDQYSFKKQLILDKAYR